MQEIESEVNSFRLTTRDFQVSGVRCSDGEENVIEIAFDVFRRNIASDFRVADKLDSCLFKQGNASVDDGFVEFPVRDAVTEKAARLRTFFINGNGVTLTT